MSGKIKIKKGDQLKVKNKCNLGDEGDALTVGRFYRVTRVVDSGLKKDQGLYVRNNLGFEHRFTFYPDKYGETYKDYFDKVTNTRS